MTAMGTPESESSVTGAFARLAGLRATGNERLSCSTPPPKPAPLC